jgi:hypothetical protein
MEPYEELDRAIGDEFKDTVSSFEVMCNSEILALYSSKRFGPRTELDSHANMPVVGANVLIINQHGIKCQVSSYNPENGPNEQEIVDCAIKHECPVTGEVTIGLLYGALRVKNLRLTLFHHLCFVKLVGR